MKAAPGTSDHPVRIAILGAGPAGFYAAGHLLKLPQVVEIDLIDKLPTPFGLVRSGVAPDHQKIKNVTRVYDKIARSPGFRFFGNVEYGKHIMLEDLKRHYHQIYFSTGAQIDRRLGIEGEDLARSYSATDFVAWYNGHPDYRHMHFDLSRECIAVVGVGNVAVDVSRIFCRTIEELERTDIADYALEALANSRVKEIYMLGRRGPAQAAFTNPEAKELGAMIGADAYVLPEEAALDPLSRAIFEQQTDRATAKKVAMIEEFSRKQPTGKPRRLTIRFLVSPVAFQDDGEGGVGGVRLVKNELYESEDGRLRPRATDRREELPAEVVFRSVGYRGVALPGLPFHDAWGVVPNEHGRVINPENGKCVRGVYVGGWIKRGPTGVIGTNKPDALDTVRAMREDQETGQCIDPIEPGAMEAEETIKARQAQFITWEDWERINAVEVARGQAVGRPRIKFTRTEDMLAMLGS